MTKPNRETQLALAKARAKKSNGQCLSTSYIGCQEPLAWKCAVQSHPIWYSTFDNVVKKNTWCPACSLKGGVQEFRVRKILEYVLGTKFFKTRSLDWNRNPLTNRCLELDGYSKKLRLAFEFQGEQHSRLIFTSMKPERLKNIKLRDEAKLSNCKQNGVKLIVIHEPKSKKDYKNQLLKAVFSELMRLEIPIKRNVSKEQLDHFFSLSHNSLFQKKQLDKARLYAISKLGVCLSDSYVNSGTHMVWKCVEATHATWKSSYENVVISGHWCPECAGNQRKPNGILIAKEFARNKGGQCLSEEYINSKTKLLWRCACPSHSTWTANYQNVVNSGNWCPECGRDAIAAKNRKSNSLELAQKIAKERGGVCLSQTYTNSATQLEWKCTNPSHPIWSASFLNIKNYGSWCPACRSEKNQNND